MTHSVESMAKSDQNQRRHRAPERDDDMGQNSSQPTGIMAVNADTQPTTEDSTQVDKARHRTKKNRTESIEGAVDVDLDRQSMDDRQPKKTKKRKRVSGEAAEVGHESDKVEPDVTAKKTRRKRKKDISIEDRDNEEAESALALVDLRNGGQSRELPSSYEDDLAASAQLRRESSPITSAQRPRPDELPRRFKGGKKKKKRLSDGLLEAGSNGLGVLDSIQESSERDAHPVTRYRHDHSFLPTPSVGQAGQAQPMLSLDDIDSNDEAIASYLEEYQTEMSSPKSSGLYMNEHLGQEDDLEGLALAALGDEALTAPASGNDSPRLSNPPENAEIAKKQKQKKLKRTTESTFDMSLEDTNGITNTTGQSNYTWSSRSVTEHCGSINFGLTNQHLFNTVDKTQTHPRFGHEGHSVMQMENHLEESGDFETSQHVKAGKLKRIPSQKRKQKLSSKKGSRTNGNVHQTPDNNNSTEHQQEVQDSDLPDAEDMQGQAPQAQASGSNAKPKKQRKKRQMQLNGSAPSSSQSKSRSSQRPANYNPSLTDLAQKGGMFTASEIAQLHHFRDNYCTEHGMSHARFATDRIHANAHNNPTLSSFWTELIDILPYRTRSAIQKCCRRQFHPYEKRGSWTKDEDRMLREAIELKGKSWVAVGQMCDRLPEDCRDRYRNHICSAEVKNERAWTDQEVRQLCQAVGECIYLMRDDRRKLQELGVESDTDAADALGGDEMKYVNWQIVSERMNGIRSRIQCSYKFKALKHRDRDLYMRQFQEARKNAAVMEQRDIPKTTHWRLHRARMHVEAKMLPGDKYDVLQAVFHCDVEREEEIPWKKLGKGEVWRDRWGAVECKVAWEMMKEEAEEVEGDYKEVAEKLLQELMEKEGGRLEERWVGETEDKKLKKQKKKEERRKKEKGKSKGKRVNNPVLSNEFVEDSHDEMEEGTTYDGREDADQSNMTANGDQGDETLDQSNIDPALMDIGPSTRGIRDSLGIEDDDGDAQMVRNLELLRNA